MHFSRESALRLPLFSQRSHTPAVVLAALGHSLRQHPKRVASTLAVLLLGTGVTAFGVAPLAPDAADLPVRQVVETVQPLPTQVQTDALSDFRFNLFRTESTRSTDTAATLLKRLNLDDAQAAAFVRTDANAQLILRGRAGKTVTAEASESQQLLKLSMRWPTDDDSKFQRLVIERSASGFTSRRGMANISSSSSAS